MENPTSQLVEEAVLAIKQGEISLETGGARFGAAWPQIKGEVALILDLEKAGEAFKTGLPTLNLDKMWSQILPGLTPVEILPRNSNGNGAHHGQAIPSNILKITTPDTTENAAPAPEPSRTTAPIKLPTQKRKTAWERWRKPLAWVAGLALIVVLSLSSLVGVANAAEPGDFFYGTKLWLDSARQYVAFSPEDKQNFALSYCEHRSQELEWLVKNNKLQYFSSVAGDYRQTLQKAFPKDTSALTSAQANQLKAQQNRLNQLSGQLSQVNASGASQASAEVEKLVEQLGTYKAPGQNNPTPTPTPGQSPTASPTPAITPSISPSVPATSGAIMANTPSVTTAAPAVSPTVSISTPEMTVVVIPDNTPTSTPVVGEDGSNGGLSYHPTPTQVASGNGNGDNGPQDGGGIDKSSNNGPNNIPGNTTRNNSDNGSSSSNNSGNGTSSDNNSGNGNNNKNSHHSPTPVPAQPTPTPEPTATPTPAPTATPTPAQTTGAPENGNNGNPDGNNGKGNANGNNGNPDSNNGNNGNANGNNGNANGNNGNANGNNGNGNGNGGINPNNPKTEKPTKTPKAEKTPKS